MGMYVEKVNSWVLSTKYGSGYQERSEIRSEIGRIYIYRKYRWT